MDTPLPPPDTPFGKVLRERLESEIVIWMTTVGQDGTPQPNPVWFLWDGESILTYNRADAVRVAHVRQRPRVALHFDGNGKGGAIAVLVGDAEVVTAEPAQENPAYVAKYKEQIERIGHDLAGFGDAYPIAIRIRPTKARGF